MNYFRYVGHFGKELKQFRSKGEYSKLPPGEGNMVELQDMAGHPTCAKEYKQNPRNQMEKSSKSVEDDRKVDSPDFIENEVEELTEIEVTEDFFPIQDGDTKTKEALEHEVEEYKENFDSNDLTFEVIESEDKSQLISEILGLRDTVEALEKRSVHSYRKLNTARTIKQWNRKPTL